MENELNLQDLRNDIDDIDRQIVELFKKRLSIANDVAQYKIKNDIPVLDSARERSQLLRIAELSGTEYADDARVLYSTIFSLSRMRQHKLIDNCSLAHKIIENSLKTTPPIFPAEAVVACQGTEGAYSQLAALKLFKYPQIKFYRSFEEVFEAVEQGECKYGVLPLENSTAGSVEKIYDCMDKHEFYINRSVRLKIAHSLMACKGAILDNITDIYSHEQAINQCSDFLKTLKNVNIHPCANTATAAKIAANDETGKSAALCSTECAKIYSLTVLKENVQNYGNNHTRFICISKDCEIYPGANKTGIMAVTENSPGALFRLLSLFFALGINLSKLESRPIPDCDFEFMFYFDLEASVYSENLLRLLDSIESTATRFRYLGSYSEMI